MSVFTIIVEFHQRFSSTGGFPLPCVVVIICCERWHYFGRHHLSWCPIKKSLDTSGISWLFWIFYIWSAGQSGHGIHSKNSSPWIGCEMLVNYNGRLYRRRCLSWRAVKKSHDTTGIRRLFRFFYIWMVVRSGNGIKSDFPSCWICLGVPWWEGGSGWGLDGELRDRVVLACVPLVSKIQERERQTEREREEQYKESDL